jgi:hypothetical protein
VPGFTDGAVYGPEVRPGVHEYFAVVGDARITSYSRGFPEHTSLDIAIAQVLRDDFPPDATVAGRNVGDPACAIVFIESDALHAITDTHAIAAFFSDPERPDAPLDPGDIYDAYVFSASREEFQGSTRC